MELSVFSAGIAVMVVEIGGARLLSPFFGDTLFSWTGSITVVLAALALGYYIGGQLARGRAVQKALSAMFFAAGAAILAVPAISLPVMSLCSLLGFEYGPLAASVLLFALPNVFIGMIAPYAVRLKARSLGAVGSSAGNLYSISTGGSIIGALATAYLLVPYLGINESFMAAGLLSVATGIALFGIETAPVFLVAILACLASPLQFAVPFHGNVIYQADSQYYHVAVINASGVTELRTGLLGIQTIAYHSQSDGAFQDYYVYQLPIYGGPDRVYNTLYLGLGGGAMVSYAYAHSNASIDAVEIDPAVIRAAASFFNVSNNSRVRIYNEDARFFLGHAAKKYGIIVLDTYGSSYSMPSYMVTLQAVQEMRADLAPNGSVMVNVISSLDGPGSDVLGSVYSTFRAVFPNVYVFAINGYNSTDLGLVRNIVLIASSNATEWPQLRGGGAPLPGVPQDLSRAMLSDYYLMPARASLFPVLTDDLNPLDVYASAVISSLK